MEKFLIFGQLFLHFRFTLVPTNDCSSDTYDLCTQAVTKRNYTCFLMCEAGILEVPSQRVNLRNKWIGDEGVSLQQLIDGTPYISASPIDYLRTKLSYWKPPKSYICQYQKLELRKTMQAHIPLSLRARMPSQVAQLRNAVLYARGRRSGQGKQHPHYYENSVHLLNLCLMEGPIKCL